MSTDELISIALGGEENPFADADWESSWSVRQVDDAQWQSLRDELRQLATSWTEAAKQPRDWDEISFTGALASVTHIGYHLGAIRQLIVGHTQ